MLNAVIELLEHTSPLISLFNDKTPIKTLSDERLSTLRRIAAYFEQFSGKERVSSFTSECLYDIQCCIHGFLELCQRMVKNRGQVIPAFINSDIVENHFSHVRTLYNGSNDHPTYAIYCALQNSIILTQPIALPGKRNANTYIRYLKAS